MKNPFRFYKSVIEKKSISALMKLTKKELASALIKCNELLEDKAFMAAQKDIITEYLEEYRGSLSDAAAYLQGDKGWHELNYEAKRIMNFLISAHYEWTHGVSPHIKDALDMLNIQLLSPDKQQAVKNFLVTGLSRSQTNVAQRTIITGNKLKGAELRYTVGKSDEEIQKIKTKEMV